MYRPSFLVNLFKLLKVFVFQLTFFFRRCLFTYKMEYYPLKYLSSVRLSGKVVLMWHGIFLGVYCIVLPVVSHCTEETPS